MGYCQLLECIGWLVEFRVFVLQSRRYSSGSSCWDEQRYNPYRHTPGSDAVQKTRTFRFFGVVSLAWSESNNDARRAAPPSGALRLPCDPPDPPHRADQANLAGLARCSIARSDGSRNSASRGSEPLRFVSRKQSELSRAQPQRKTWHSSGSLSDWLACTQATGIG
jgi:hypothetical protein